MNRILSRALPVLLAAVFLSPTGCDSGPKMVKVSGIVLIDGKPLTTGFVQVSPTGHRAATGKIGSDGRFTLTTTAEGDGTFTGTHPTAVIGTESLGPGSQKWHAPKKYIAAESSGITVVIDGPTKDLKIDLSWGGDKPFVEQFGKEN